VEFVTLQELATERERVRTRWVIGAQVGEGENAVDGRVLWTEIFVFIRTVI